jgi:hypothetical protein
MPIRGFCNRALQYAGLIGKREDNDTLLPKGLARFDPATQIIRRSGNKFIIENKSLLKRYVYWINEKHEYEVFLGYIYEELECFNESDKDSLIAFLSTLSKVDDQWNFRKHLRLIVNGMVCLGNGRYYEDRIKNNYNLIKFLSNYSLKCCWCYGRQNNNVDFVKNVLLRKDLRKVIRDGRIDLNMAYIWSCFQYGNIEVLNCFLSYRILRNGLWKKTLVGVCERLCSYDNSNDYLNYSDARDALINIITNKKLRKKLPDDCMNKCLFHAYCHGDADIVERVLQEDDIKKRKINDSANLAFIKDYELGDFANAKLKLKNEKFMKKISCWNLNYAFTKCCSGKTNGVLLIDKKHMLKIILLTKYLREKLTTKTINNFFDLCCEENIGDLLHSMLQYRDVRGKLTDQNVADNYKVAYCTGMDYVVKVISRYNDLKGRVTKSTVNLDFIKATCYSQDYDVLNKILENDTLRQQLSGESVNEGVRWIALHSENPLYLMVCLFKYSDIKQKLDDDTLNTCFHSMYTEDGSYDLLALILQDDNLRPRINADAVDRCLGWFVNMRYNEEDYLNLILTCDDLREKISAENLNIYVKYLSEKNCCSSIFSLWDYPDLRQKLSDDTVSSEFKKASDNGNLSVAMKILSYSDLLIKVKIDYIAEMFLRNYNADRQEECADIYNLAFVYPSLKLVKTMEKAYPRLFEVDSVFFNNLSAEAHDQLQLCLKFVREVEGAEGKASRTGNTVRLEMLELPRITYMLDSKEMEYRPQAEDKVPFIQEFINSLKEAVETCDNEDIVSVSFRNITYTINDNEERTAFLRRIRAFMPLVIPPVLDESGSEVDFSILDNRKKIFATFFTFLDGVTLTDEQKKDFMEETEYAHELNGRFVLGKKPLNELSHGVITRKAIGHEHFSLSPKEADSKKWEETDRMIAHIIQHIQKLKDDNDSEYVNKLIFISQSLACTEGYCFGRYTDEIRQAYAYINERVLPEKVEGPKQFEVAFLDELEVMRNSIFTQYLADISRFMPGMHTHIFSLGNWVMSGSGFSALGIETSPDKDLVASSVFGGFGAGEAYIQWEKAGKTKEGMEPLRQAALAVIRPTLLKEYNGVTITERAKKFLDDQLDLAKQGQARNKVTGKHSMNEGTFFSHMGRWMNSQDAKFKLDPMSMFKEDYKTYVDSFSYSDVIKLVLAMRAV